jgi:Winged helix-turn-helix DNA-binding
MIDWARTERLYRQGEISNREIARREGVSEGAVRKRAKAQGWKRESTISVRPQGGLVSPRPAQTAAAQSSGTRVSAEHGFSLSEEGTGFLTETPTGFLTESRSERTGASRDHAGTIDRRSRRSRENFNSAQSA